jgi:hypothetical protein
MIGFGWLKPLPRKMLPMIAVDPAAPSLISWMTPPIELRTNLWSYVTSIILPSVQKPNPLLYRGGLRGHRRSPC